MAALVSRVPGAGGPGSAVTSVPAPSEPHARYVSANIQKLVKRVKDIYITLDLTIN